MNRFKPGDYLIVDEISGLEIWASDAGYDWDGSIRHKDNIDGKHPDYFYKHYIQEQQPDMINIPVVVTAYSNVKPSTIGNTTVSAPPGPADHLFS